MKILYCIPALYNSGGMERILSEKANWLVRHGYEVDIVTTEQGGRSPFFSLSPKIRLIHLDIDFNSHVDANPLKKLYQHYAKLRRYKYKLQRLVRENGYDVVISLCGKEIEFIASLDIKSRKIAELHFSQNFKTQFMDSRHRSRLHRLAGRFLTQSFVKSTKKLDALVVLTKEDEQQWLQTNSNVRQIYNFTPSQKSPKENYESTTNRCIAVGRLDEQKGFDLLIPAWELVAKKRPDWFLDIYGVGKWDDMLRDEIAARGIKGKVRLRGQSLHIDDELRQSDIFVLSSRYEGFPMVLLEAVASGLTIVSFDCQTGPKEIVEDGINGLLVENGNIEALAEAVLKLIDNQDLRAAFGRKSIDVGQKFDKENIMAQWDALLHEIVC